MCIFSRGICSATSGEIFGLKPPVPIPMMIMPMMKAARDECVFLSTCGAAEVVRMTWPVMEMQMEIQMVLNRPSQVSAMYAPNSGMT